MYVAYRKRERDRECETCEGERERLRERGRGKRESGAERGNMPVDLWRALCRVSRVECWLWLPVPNEVAPPECCKQHADITGRSPRRLQTACKIPRDARLRAECWGENWFPQYKTPHMKWEAWPPGSKSRQIPCEMMQIERCYLPSAANTMRTVANNRARPKKHIPRVKKYIIFQSHFKGARGDWHGTHIEFMFCHSII